MQEQNLEFWIARIQDHFIGVFTFDLGRYLIAASALSLFLWVASEWSAARRIQHRQAQRSDYIREVSSSFRTVFFFALTGLSTVLLIEAGVVKTHDGPYDLAPFIVQIVAITLFHDAYFYWMHRVLHHRRLFRATHLHHHKSRTPTPWAAYSFSAWEGVTEAAFMPIFLLLASLAGVEYMGSALFAFLAWMIARNVMGHAGVELHPAGWVDSKWTDWLTTTTHHDLHHSEGNHNFGLYFTWWDRWMGTEHPEYKARFRAVAKPLVMSLRLAEKLSVALMALFASAITLSVGAASMGAFGV
ncbi:sterol desaturase family protein [Altererythrobacter sp. BO-6]|uniref:sterol desaturase family protein n=1 Tax=Altererythrobacter sp. BO-6 TaxID=2604537 RepID=UPI0013E156AF|nr:sterol desaturase family protein [Altererythrobacter sp. BO-6]QIG55094.1 sterol desaturase family protein [Altererythrobacter sp. BO-6]